MSPSEFMREYETITNAHDTEALIDLIADDAIYLFGNQSSHVGKDAVRKAIQANFDALKAEKYRIHDLVWPAHSDDVAACVYEFDRAGEINGMPASGRGWHNGNSAHTRQLARCP